MFIMLELLPSLLLTKATLETYGSITCIFCFGVTIRSCKFMVLNSSRAKRAESSEPWTKRFVDYDKTEGARPCCVCVKTELIGKPCCQYSIRQFLLLPAGFAG